VPLVLAAGLLAWLAPITTPVALILLAHAWAIPELYAVRGAKVIRRRGSGRAASEARALLLLGDLLAHDARECYGQSGLVVEPGQLGTWVVGEAGALLVRPRGRRVNCYCVKATDSELPSPDRIAHLLLALREDEIGFATIANLAFSGACWRLRRRLDPPARDALRAARRIAAYEFCTQGQWQLEVGQGSCPP
jgi:hypothetical protein